MEWEPGVESSDSRRQARTGVLPASGRGEAAALLLSCSLAIYEGRHPVCSCGPPTPAPGADSAERADQVPKCQHPPFCSAPASPRKLCAWSSDPGAPSLRSRCRAVPGLEPRTDWERGQDHVPCFPQLSLFPSSTAPHVGILYLNQEKQSC